jgi:hypothetical protein
MSVGIELTNEIERIGRKHERWLGMMEEFPEMKPGMSIGAAVMKAEIEAAKSALQSDDPARAIQALKSLQDYDDKD